MKPLIAVIAAFAVVLMFPWASLAEVYKGVDDKGGVHFTEDPSTIPELARLLRVKDGTIYAWLSRKSLRIPNIRVGSVGGVIPDHAGYRSVQGTHPARGFTCLYAFVPGRSVLV
jgi:hypothetical protein